ncbi:MAG: HAD family hydrolase [Candidatus Omnitrophica bacterium]|nr:HAD family hydrolase [Candidatus Omnitrophota bacterium]
MPQFFCGSNAAARGEVLCAMGNGYKAALNAKLLFIFDLDGTLVDAYTAIEKSLNFTRARFGYDPVPLKTAKKSVGNGDRNFVACFFPDREVDAALAMYRDHHKLALPRYARLKPYARMLLSRLRRAEKRAAIASNRPSPYTKIIVQSLDIAKYFDCVLCADEVQSLKPDPKILREVLRRCDRTKEQSVYVGDMDVDMETAQRAGMDAVFVTGGSSTIAAVKQYRRKQVARSLRDIITRL